MKKIGAEDIFKELDIFKSLRDSAKKSITTLTEMNREMIKIAKTIKETLGTTRFETMNSINSLNKAQSESNRLMLEAIKIEKMKGQANEQLIKSEAEITRLEILKEKHTQSQLNTEKQRIALEKQKQQALDKANSAAAKAVALAEKENSAYQKLSKSTALLKKASKELAATMYELELSGKKNTTEYRKLASQYDATTKKAIEADAKLKAIDKTVGDNQRNVGNYTGAIDKLKQGLGALGIAFGGAMVFQSGAKALIEFNQQLADLSAITGASGADLEFYGSQANKLGVSVEGGASAVVEAYKLIGSAKPELLENAKALDAVTQSAITLSQASGMALPDAALALTDAMNQFGAGAEDADKFVNVLANGAKFGAAEIPQITEALLKFGAVAKTTNTPIEESVALIEALAEKGLKGAEAGTALRNVMLKLSAPDALPKEAQKRLEEMGLSLKELADPTKTVTEKLAYLKPLLKDTGTLVKVFGTENAVSAMALIQTTKRVDELNKSMYTNDTATKAAADRTNTLGHALMEVKNEFMALFTSIGTGSGSMQNVINGFKFLANNLGTIFSIIGKVVRTWIIYKGVQKAIQLSNFITSGGFRQLGIQMMSVIPGTRAYTLAQHQVARANAAAGNSAKTAGNAMKTIPWVLIISGLVELYNWWSNVASASAQARKQADLYKQAQENANQKALAVSDDTKKAYDEEIRKSDLLFRTKIANAKSASEKAKLEKEMLEAHVKVQDRFIQKNKESLYANQENARYVKVLQKEFVQLADKASDWGLNAEETKRKISLFNELMKYGVNMTLGDQGFTERVKERINQRVATLDANVNQLSKDLKSFQDINDEAEVAALEASISQADYNVNIDKTNEKIPTLKGFTEDLGDANEKLAISYKEINDYLQDTNNLLRELEIIYENRAVAKLTKEIEALVKKAKESNENGNIVMGITLKETGDNASESDIVKNDVENLKLLVDGNTELNQKIKEKNKLELENLQNQLKFDKNKLIDKNLSEKNKEIDELKQERDDLLAKEPEKKTEILEKYEIRVKELSVEHKQRDEDLATSLLILDEKLYDDKGKLIEKEVQEITDANQQILDANKTKNQKIADSEQKLIDEDKKKNSEKLEREKQIVDAMADYFIKGSEKKIAQAEKEISALEKTQGMLEELANNGNIKASESLALNNKLIVEANKKKEKELKRIERIKLAQSVYGTYQKHLDSDSKTPLADTIKDVALLQAFIQSLPTFEKGTEDTGSNGSGIDGKGGFKAILHPNERVVPKSLNDQIKGMSNKDLTKLAVDYKNGEIIHKNSSSQIMQSLNFGILVQKMETLNETIKNKPTTNIELGEISSTMFEIIESTKTGNTKIYNRFKIKK